MDETTTGPGAEQSEKGRLAAVKDAVPAEQIKRRATKAASGLRDTAGKVTGAATGIKGSATKAASGARESATKAAGTIRDKATKAASGVKEGASKATEEVTTNPLLLGLVSAASGFAVGMLVPLTPVEKQRLPEVADRAKGATMDGIQQVRTTGVANAADQIESAADAAVEAVVSAAKKKIPGVASIADKVEESAKRGTRKVTRTVRDKAGT